MDRKKPIQLRILNFIYKLYYIANYDLKKIDYSLLVYIENFHYSWLIIEIYFPLQILRICPKNTVKSQSQPATLFAEHYL